MLKLSCQLLATVVTALATGLVAAAADSEQLERQWSSQIAPLLKTHCYDCHSGAEADAGLALDHFDTPLSVLKGRRVWEMAIQKIQIGEMPPPDVDEMSDVERKTVTTWLRAAIDDYECGLTPNPGQVTLRRLNATEYQNTIRDLVGLVYTPANDFPGDDTGYGFDNIGDVLTLPPILMEKYLIAAEKISRRAIQTPEMPSLLTIDTAGSQLEVDANSSGGDSHLTLASSGTATLSAQIPRAATFEITVTASGDQVGREPCMMVVSVDNKIARRIAVPNTHDSPGEFSVRTRLRAGGRKIGFSFVNDLYIKAQGGQPKQDRNLTIHHVWLQEVAKTSPKLDPKKVSAQHRHIIFVQPSGPSQYDEASRKIMQRFASRAYRRPVEANDLDRLVKLAKSIRDEGGSFEEGIQVAVQAVLISPKFLFRVEPPSSDLEFNDYRDLDEFELATRLSYFLWSSMPDDELLAYAVQGKLREGNNLERQIARMLRHPHSNAFVRNFVSQWLKLRALEEFRPSPRDFPRWNAEIKELAERETYTFFAAVMRRNMSILRLLDGEFTYLNEKLARYYGITGVEGDSFQPVSLKGSQRAGLLTQASVLAVTSHPTRTSPVKRGQWILENLLNSPPPPAPAGVPELKEKGQLVGTMREQLEQHRADPACASCHKLMDPLGFALENFDAIGLYREQDNGIAIDASGILPDGTKVNGARDLRDVLSDKEQEKFVRCFVEKVMTYALGRGLEYYDKCAVDQIMASLENTDYKFSSLLVGIVRSDPFQKKGQREIE